jgi:hypothetical protein
VRPVKGRAAQSPWTRAALATAGVLAHGWAGAAPWAVAAVALGASVHARADAAPVEGTGVAEIEADGDTTAARKKALSRARRAALDSALGSAPAPVDAAAKKAVTKAAEAWTGAYRILEQSSDGAKITVRVEVDIDTVRLHKRVAKKKDKSTEARWSLGEVLADDGCGAADAAFIEGELTGLHAVSKTGADAVTLELSCRELGAVRYTHMQAATVSATATGGRATLAHVSVHGFGADGPEAIRAGMQAALEDVAIRLRAHASGRVLVRVESPLPSARVRRFEQVLRNSVPGVDEVDVVGIEPGVVRLGVAGDISARLLAERIEALSLPGFSVTIAGMSEPDVLTIRFH